MIFFKTIWKNKPSRIWAIVTASVLVFIMVVSLVLTQASFITETFNTLFGGPRQVIKNAGPMIYESDYESKDATLKAANALSERIMEEGAVLLKNDGSLPLAAGSKISVFGKNSVNMVHGGTGSGEKGTEGLATLYSSLSDAGFLFNTRLRAFYESSTQSGSGRPASPGMGTYVWGFETGETPWSSYSSNTEVMNSFAEYNAAALVVFSRIAGEGYDLPRSMMTLDKDGKENGKVLGARDATDHYLQLDENEAELLKQVSDSFDNVIVIINSSAVLELGFLDDPNIKGAIWIGNPGGTGLAAIGRILKGDVNPSGRLVDTYMRDMKKDPTWENFAFNLQKNGNRYRASTADKPDILIDRPYYFVDYEEGIYVGYRYWETRGYTEFKKDGNYSWYNANVVYPFGYGLSYSTFDWKFKGGAGTGDGATVTKDGKISYTIEVTNNGPMAGKDVVQLYYSAPYYDGGIEKSHVVLGGFAKTPEIPANQTREVTITVNIRDMASYDWNDANGNGFTGYEVEAGTYTIYLAKNAKGWQDPATLKRTIKVEATGISEEDITKAAAKGNNGFAYKYDEKTGTEIKNLFDQAGAKVKSANPEETGGTMTLLSRNGWIDWPTKPTLSDRTVSESFIDSLKYPDRAWTRDTGKPWHVPASKKPVQSAKKLNDKQTTIKLYDLIGKPHEDPDWQKLLDQLTIAELAKIIGSGNFHTQAVESIVKPRTTDPDGPVGFTNFMEMGGQPTVYGTCFYVSATVVSSTWNKELAEEQGKMVGNEGIWGNQRGDKRPYSGWYAPAVNIHRTPFSGRNWEYYSEDGYLSGMMAASVVKGAKEKGVYTYVKHFAVNDQETDRVSEGLVTWVDEQTMREIYFRPFELAVKVGETRAMMSSFNRIGKEWAGGSYALLTELLRDEWGFRGMVITDYNVYGYMPADQMIRAGGDLNLIQDKPPTTSSSALTPTQIALMRKAVHNILYTVANSNAMNRLTGARIAYSLPNWIVFMIVADVVIFAGLAGWGGFVIWRVLKKKTEQI